MNANLEGRTIVCATVAHATTQCEEEARQKGKTKVCTKYIVQESGTKVCATVATNYEEEAGDANLREQ